MSKRLITDRDVLEGRVTAPLVLDGDTIVTPSALDRLCRMGIAVVDGRGGAVSAESGGAVPAGVSAALEGLADGTYLVGVQGGRVVSVLASTGPGRTARAGRA